MVAEGSHIDRDAERELEHLSPFELKSRLIELVVDRHAELLLNAGRGNPPGEFTEWTAEQWREVVDVNLNGMFFCMQQAFRVMRAQSPQGGRIINNGSISAHAPRPNSIAYTATKHAVMGLTKTGALDGRSTTLPWGRLILATL